MIRKLLEKATKGRARIELDRVMTKDGGGMGEPSQELIVGNTPIARFTVYSRLADGDLVECLLRNAPALAELIEAATDAQRILATLTDPECQHSSASVAWAQAFTAEAKLRAALAKLQQ